MQKIFWAFALCMSQLRPLAFAKVFSFDELARMLAQKNLKVQVNQNIQKKEYLEMKLAKRDFWLPKLSYGFTYLEESTQDGPLDELASNRVASADESSFLGQLDVTYNLFNGFKDFFLLEETKSSFLLAGDEKRLEISNLLKSLKSIYLKVSLEKNRLKIIESELEKDRQILKQAKRRYRKGLVPKSDVNRAQILFLKKSDEKRAQHIAIKNLILQIKKLLHQKEDFPLDIIPFDYQKLSGELVNLIQQIEKMGPKELAQNLHSQYLKQGPKHGVFKRKVGVQGAAAKKVRGDFLPQLKFFGQHNYRFNDNLGKRNASKRDEIVFGLKLTIPLFDSFDTVVAHRQEKLLLANSELDLKRTGFETFHTLKELANSLYSEYQSYQVTKKKFKLQSYIFETGLKRYNRGAVTLFDLIQDKEQLEKERFELVEKSNNLRKFLLEIEATTGQLLGIDGVSGEV